MVYFRDYDTMDSTKSSKKEKNLTSKCSLILDPRNFDSNNEQSQLLKFFLSIMSFGTVLYYFGLYGRIF